MRGHSGGTQAPRYLSKTKASGKILPPFDNGIPRSANGPDQTEWLSKIILNSKFWAPRKAWSSPEKASASLALCFGPSIANAWTTLVHFLLGVLTT